MVLRIRAAMSAAISLIACAVSSTAFAYVPAAVGGRPGETDVSARVAIERGLVEPNENPASRQRASWEVYTVDAGHTFGDVGPLRDFFVRVSFNHARLPAERNERGEVPADRCLGTSLSPTSCEFHPADTASYVTAAVGFNAVHTPSYALGFFLQGSIPFGLDDTKFVTPRVDHVAFGTQIGVRLAPWLSYLSRIHVGTGLLGSPRMQNATVAITNLFVFEARRWLLPWKIGLQLGPYFDADLTERNDERYDAAYTAGYELGVRDRIRSMRFAIAMLPYVQVTEHAVIELGYVQKLFGYDTPATKFFTLGVRVAF